jgi:catechol 2,3-dioxygenase-like lactoylglutathione lyase family enzyme
MRSFVPEQHALDFYRDLLGFKMVDEFRHERKPDYARLRAPGATAQSLRTW